MRLKTYHGVSFLAGILFMMATSGCGTTVAVSKKILPDSLAKKVLPGQPLLKKRIMVLPFVNQADVGPEIAENLSRAFYESLKQSPNLLLYEPPDGIFSSMAMETPQYGIVTSSKLVDFAEKQGMNAIVVGVLNPVEIMTRKTGWWPFDKWRKIYIVSVSVNVIDTVSKTLFLTHMESQDFSIPLEEADETDPEAFIHDCLTEALPDLIAEQVSTIETQLDGKPWTGQILAVEDDTVMINAGKDVGLKEGQRFEVFASGRAVSSGSGRQVHLLGEAEGEIETTTVMDGHALADPVSGGPFETKQFVRIKR
ncbi:MAG: hypothetical protein R6U38_09370 [Desulfatiglandaceae bacterium]